MLLTNNLTFFAKVCGTANITLQVYSQPSLYNVSFHQHDEDNVTGKHNITHWPAVVVTQFYGVQVELNGSLVNLVIPDLQTVDFGVYTVSLTNEMGTATVDINLFADSKYVY